VGPSGIRAGALLAFVLAEGVAAHPRAVTKPVTAPLDIRLVGSTANEADGDAYARGKQLLAADDVIGALAAFRVALRAAPESADAMNGVGVAYDRLGRTDLARRFYQAGLEIDPASPALLNNLGYSLFLAGDRAGAVAPLRAAAASADPDAAATARATLARLASEPRGPQAEEVAAAPVAPARIELTSDGEQRLTFAPPAPAHDVAAALGDDAVAIVVAAAWSAADDRAMVARVRTEEAADTAMFAALQTIAPAPAPAPVMAAVAAAPPPPPPTPQHSAESIAAPRARAIDAPRARSALVLAAADSTARRRVRGTGPDVTAALSGGPQPRAAIAFDSDDAELNAFAARVRPASPAMARVPSEHSRIAARFRA